MLLPAQEGGAKALLLTVLGEFVLPAGGEAWTASLVAAADVLGIGEKNARQAISRIADQGLLEGVKHGRAVRWSLTTAGHQLLESGAQRIYEFGTSAVDWDGQWLVAHCPVTESQRGLRNQLRTELGFLGFGELSPSLLVSPHVKRDDQLREVLSRLGLIDESTVLHSSTMSDLENAHVVSKAWDLEELAASYRGFSRAFSAVSVDNPEDAFTAVVELVHDWRRFPFTDPELPTELLPAGWAGTQAVVLFHAKHNTWSADAQAWFRALEAN